MKNIIAIGTLSLFVVIGLVACKVNPQRHIAGSYTFESECMGVEMDGSQTLKAWGRGRNRIDAVEQSKKNAVRDVIFKGIRNGKSDCNQKPLLFEVNAIEKYEDYFNLFFTDKGAYKEFISPKDGNDWHIQVWKDRKQEGDQEMYGTTVRVLRAQLKQKLISDNILKQ